MRTYWTKLERNVTNYSFLKRRGIWEKPFQSFPIPECPSFMMGNQIAKYE